MKGRIFGTASAPYLFHSFVASTKSPYGTLGESPSDLYSCAAGVDYMTDWSEMASCPDGERRKSQSKTWLERARSFAATTLIDDARSGNYVHYDALYERNLNAALILLGGG